MEITCNFGVPCFRLCNELDMENHVTVHDFHLQLRERLPFDWQYLILPNEKWVATFEGKKSTRSSKTSPASALFLHFRMKGLFECKGVQGNTVILRIVLRVLYSNHLLHMLHQWKVLRNSEGKKLGELRRLPKTNWGSSLLLFRLPFCTSENQKKTEKTVWVLALLGVFAFFSGFVLFQNLPASH